MAIHEECGVFGIFGTKRENVANTAYYGLYALQHRGQESCGINFQSGHGGNSSVVKGMINTLTPYQQAEGSRNSLSKK